MNPATLDALWVAVRRHLLLLANGATTSFEQKVTSGKSDSTGPTFRHQELAGFEKRWAGAKSSGAKRKILNDALEMIFYHSPRARQKAVIPLMPEATQERFRKLALGQSLLQLRGTETWRVAVATEPGTVRQVAAIYGEARQNVQRWREEHARKVTRRNGHVEPTRSTVHYLRTQMIELDARAA